MSYNPEIIKCPNCKKNKWVEFTGEQPDDDFDLHHWECKKCGVEFTSQEKIVAVNEPKKERQE